MTWEIKKFGKKKFKTPIFIEGLPGIGNVGKIAADLLLQELEGDKVAEFFSYSLPNSVFVQEDNLVELPSVEVHHVNNKKRDFLFLVGDVQPLEGESSYEFADTVINYMVNQKCKELITLGGIGLQELPKSPKVFCTANDKKFLKEIEKNGANSEIYGKVGPIVGATGLLLGLGAQKKIKGGALLAETLAHPMYIGLKGARELLKVLNKRYDFGISTKDLDKEIKDMEEKIKMSMMSPSGDSPEVSYIG